MTRTWRCARRRCLTRDTAIRAAIAVVARALRLEVRPFGVRRLRDLVATFTALGQAPVGAPVVGADPPAFAPDLSQAVALARRSAAGD